MSRPPPKRQRRFHENALVSNDTLVSSSTAHIFASASTSASQLRVDCLHPTSYEITLNHDAELKRSLQPACLGHHDKDIQGYSTRLVTWSSSCGTQLVTTDRYDAIHLLTHLPRKSPPCSVSNDDTGWSDLESDSEDLFYMTTFEAATFTHQKATDLLEAHRASRLANLSSRSASPPLTTPEPILTRSLFELMAKTARVIASSGNASLLEMKILTNHGADERFAFLRRDGAPEQSVVWDALKRCRGEMAYEDALRLVGDGDTSERDLKADGGGAGAGLVPYDDSDSESDKEPTAMPERTAEAAATTDVAQAEVPESPHPTDPTHTPDPIEAAQAAALKQHKQAQRLARAKQWLKDRSKSSTAS